MVNWSPVAGMIKNDPKYSSVGTPKRLRSSSSMMFSTMLVALLMIIVVGMATPGLEKSAQGQPSIGDPAGSGRRLSPPTNYLEGYREDGYPAISRASQELIMAFNARGIVGEVLVHATDVVVPGQPLIRLQDDYQSWNVEVQRIAAEDTTQIEQAERRLALAEYDLSSLEEAAAKDAASPRELIHARSDLAAIKLELRAAKAAHLQAEAAYKRDQARLDNMTLRSTIAGEIVRVDVEEGEVVEEMQAILRLVNVNPLWLDVAVPIQLGLRLQAGMTAVVSWRDVQHGVPVEGTVKYVLPVADAASNSIVVRVEVQNDEELPSGLHALLKFPEMEDAWLRDAAAQDR